MNPIRGETMAPKATTWLQVSGYRFLLRRLECALLSRSFDEPIRAPMHALAAGALLAAIVVAASAAFAVLRPQATLGDAPIVMGQRSGALYVRVSDTLHPVLNLASARLITGTNGDPVPVAESELTHIKRGPLMGIPGGPQFLGAPLTSEETRFFVCDTDAGATKTTTVVIGIADTPRSRRLTATLLVTAGPGTSTYLLYDGRRAVVDPADSAVVRALRLEGVVPRTVSRALLNATPEAPPIVAPRIARAGSAGAVPGFPIGAVLRIARAGGDEYYVVLERGIQRVGQVTADLLRLTGAHGIRTILSVAPDVIRSAPSVDELPVSTFPDRAATPPDLGDTLCAAWAHPASGGGAQVWFTTGGLPIPEDQTPVTLSQSDGAGPAVDAVYLAPGRSTYVRATGLSGEQADAGTRYLVTETGVRFAIADDDAARDLGMPPIAVPGPWPVLATLPPGPELSRRNALVARDAP